MTKHDAAAALRVAVVDDNPLDRLHLKTLLERHGCRVEVEADSGRALLQWMASGHVLDAIFLDVEMPGGSGIDAAAEMRNPPHLVFVTGFKEYAVRAFELGAMDYILKPATPARIGTALGRLWRVEDRPRPSVFGKARGPQPVERITVRNREGEGVFLENRKVTHLEVSDGQVWACVGATRYRTGWTSLRQAAVAFPGFLRIRRDCLLNPGAVNGFRTALWGRVVVRVGSDFELEVSRTMKRQLRGRISWVPTKAC